jgi:glyceraldehyde 3-phosphate dehydrogenase
MDIIRVAINGFGRIGRTFFKVAYERDDIEVVAINDLGDIETLAYLLQYDTVYGRAPFSVETREDDRGRFLVIDGREIPFHSEKNPKQLPWGEHAVDVAVESTGVFTTYKESRMHLKAGAKRVVVSAPVKDKPPKDVGGATALLGVNDDALEQSIISSNASCTTNAGSPLMAILNETIGVEKALLNTVHGYTSSQNLVDSPNDKTRRGRAAAENLVPSSTGSAIATTKAITELDGKFDGVAVRVPVPAGSLVDITFLASRDTDAEEVNAILKDAAAQDRWQGVFTTTEDPVVSSDIVGERFASIADLAFTRVVDGNLVKVMSWYDNEMGYTHTLAEHVSRTGTYIKRYERGDA